MNKILLIGILFVSLASVTEISVASANSGQLQLNPTSGFTKPGKTCSIQARILGWVPYDIWVVNGVPSDSRITTNVQEIKGTYYVTMIMNTTRDIPQGFYTVMFNARDVSSGDISSASFSLTIFRGTGSTC